MIPFLVDDLKFSKRICVYDNLLSLSPKMSSTYRYSIAVDEALRSYGAKTHGSLERRVERLNRFKDVKNKNYAAEISLEQSREDMRQQQKRRTEERIRQIYDEEREFNRQEFLRNLKDRESWQPPAACQEHRYNLRAREENGLHLLCRAIENGFVNTRRG